MTVLTKIIFLVLIGHSVHSKILPDNNLHLEDSVYSVNANISEEEFNQIIDEVVLPYEKLAKSHGAYMSVRKNWSDSTVNAYAQQIDNKWNIYMFGGLARRPEITPDAFALVVCHELGHHFAGFPFKDNDWAASEGESDYFATQSCARKIWGQQLEKNERSKNTVKSIPKDKCDAVWSKQEQRHLCYRIAMAGESLAKLLSVLREQESDFSTPDTSRVKKTFTGHPNGQCRLDTFLSGSLCLVERDFLTIPGRNNSNGQGSTEAELEAAKNSCMRAAFYEKGNRPLCWYSPQLENVVFGEAVDVFEAEGNGNEVVEPGELAGIVVRIKNIARIAYENVKGYLESQSEKFEVIQAESYFQKLSAKSSSKNNTPFLIRLSQAQCGEELGLKLKIDLGNGQETIVNHQERVGKTRKIFVEIENELPIPDFEPEGISSVLTVNSTDSFSKGVVRTNISHSHIGDLVVKLVSPAGREFVLHSREGKYKNDLKKEFPFDLSEPINVSGKWTLKVSDHGKYDFGILHGWDLKFKKYVCN